jgi:protocatechuate 3,4-dioxygenase alpha subunit
MSRQSPSQTVGPFFAYALTPELYGRTGIVGNVLVADDTPGEHVRLEGQVFDGEGATIRDAVIEIWQANGEGVYAHSADGRPRPADGSFTGFGRTGTDEQGRFWFQTIKPGAVPGPGNTLQAPHLNVIVLMRGLLSHVFTRIYFSDEAEANDACPVLGLVEPGRRATLVASRDERHGMPVYRLDIHMQGGRETVFFDA